MSKKVTKRDGRRVDYNEEKVRWAITQAFLDIDGEITEADSDKINSIVEAVNKINKDISVEEIQDLVEKKLMASDRKDVAKRYILYRDERTRLRDRNSSTRKVLKEKLLATNVQNQNANIDEHSFGGRMGEASDVLFKELALDEFVSTMARDNHINNEIYIHDLNSYISGMHNCLSVPFDKLLANGFNTRQTDVRPANSVNTAFQLVAVIFQLQSLMEFGGVSATHLDWTMIPYVRKSFYKHYNTCMDIMPYGKPIELSKEEVENTSIDSELYKGKHSLIKRRAYNKAMVMLKKEIKQAVEGMFHNLNTLQSRSGNQLPFTSINFGSCTLTEGRLIIKALLEGSLNGVGKFHKTSVFPCSIFQVGEGINKHKGDPNYDLYKLALKSTAQRLYPNYANLDWSVNEGYDKNDPCTYMATMGCRTYNGYDINGMGQRKDGRGNICPVTVILPTIAMEALNEWNGVEDQRYDIEITKDMTLVDYFIQFLGIKISEAKDMLIERFDWICSQSADSAKFMYENCTMEGYVPEEGIISALKHGTLAIGQIGLAETLQILIGCDHTEDKGMEVAKKIEQLFYDKCKEYKNEYRLNFGVYFTPECKNITSVGASIAI